MKKFVMIMMAMLFIFTAGCKTSVETLNIAVELNDHAASAYIAKDRDDFNKYGIEVDLFEQYDTGMALAAALARGDINVGYICVIPAIISYSRGVPIKIVSLTHQYGYELVSKQGIKGVQELDGKKVACPGEGSSANFVMKLVEEQYGIKFNVLRTKPLVAISALSNGSVDAVFIPEHYASILVSQGFKILLRAQDVFPEMPGSCIVVKNDIIETKPAVVKKLIKLNIAETNFINKNQKEAAKILSGYLNTNETIIENSMKNITYTNGLNINNVQFVIDKLADWGYIDERFNAEDAIWAGN